MYNIPKSTFQGRHKIKIAESKSLQRTIISSHFVFIAGKDKRKRIRQQAIKILLSREIFKNSIKLFIVETSVVHLTPIVFQQYY